MHKLYHIPDFRFCVISSAKRLYGTVFPFLTPPVIENTSGVDGILAFLYPGTLLLISLQHLVGGPCHPQSYCSCDSISLSVHDVLGDYIPDLKVVHHIIHLLLFIKRKYAIICTKS